MNVLENFKNLFIEIWQQGIAGINFTQIGVGIVIFLLFLLLRGLISNFILKRLQNYVDKTTNKFDDALVKASTGPIKFSSNCSRNFCCKFLHGIRWKNVGFCRQH